MMVLTLIRNLHSISLFKKLSKRTRVVVSVLVMTRQADVAERQVVDEENLVMVVDTVADADVVVVMVAVMVATQGKHISVADLKDQLLILM